ncbi:tyrosine-type recombinase/integrase [Psychrobacter sp. CMS30]|uniref:tyrosine-type recombinase/integrase n=1 Tax=Psychrobacter sp. CMS30 TaxID=2774126 RepID=UPI001919B8C1|nr:tyrosine-type recombinase/integrase [Psychrobacter sp. CMS30]
MSKNSFSGIDKRKVEREKKLVGAKDKALKIALIHIRVDELANKPNPQAEFTRRWNKFDQSLKSTKIFHNHTFYGKSYNYALQEIQKKLDCYDLDISFPKYIVFEQRPKLFRDSDWFQEAKKVRTFYQLWMNSFENHKEVNIYDVFLSLVFHNAILQAPLLEFIIKKLIAGDLKIQSIYNLPFVRADFNKRGYSTNVRNSKIKDEKYTSQNVFLSPISATLLRSYRLDDISLINGFLKPDGSIDIKVFYQKLLDHQKLYQILPNNLEGFLKASLYVCENHENFNLPEYYLYLLLGIKKTYSLPVDNWQCILYERPKPSDIDILEDFDAHQQHQKNSKHTEHKQLALQISRLFKPENERKDKKISGSVFDKRLKANLVLLKQEKAPINEVALLTWFVHKRLSNQPSSIQTYSNNITNRWLALTYGQNIDNFDETDFESLYAEIIALSRTTSAKNETAKLLDDFHEHLVNVYGAEPVEPMSVGAVAHVKAGYISETMFQAILYACKNLNINKEKKDAIYIALILGQRFGMRIGEIAKLKLIEISGTVEDIEVRNNIYGDNKTSSALRSLPIALLLSAEELRVLTALYHRRVEEKGQTLIADASGQTIPKNQLSQMVSGLIKKVTGLSYLTAHNLRHSCLSNIQLLHFLYDSETLNNTAANESLKDLLPYKKADAWNIYYKLFGSRKSISNYIIAGVAGHSEPSVSFNNYIHFTDIQIGLQLWNIDYQLSENQKIYLLQLPRRKQGFEVNEIYEYLLKKLKVEPLPKFEGKPIRYASNYKEVEREFGFNEVAKILRSHYMHDDFQHLLKLYDISNDEFKKWYCKAKHLKESSEYQTKFGGSRLFLSEQKNLLVPSYNLIAEDQKVMDDMERNFKRLYLSKKHKEDLDWFIRYTLQNCEYTQNKIRFKALEDFDRFLNYTIKLLPKVLIHIDIRNLQSCTDKRLLNKWKNRLNKLPESNVHYDLPNDKKEIRYTKKVKSSISIASSKEKHKKYNSTIHYNRILQVFCFYSFILLNDVKGIILK